MKKGFTLIELLAVIIILAIVALIATPIVLGSIESSKKSAAMSASTSYLNAINNFYSEKYFERGFQGYECSVVSGNGCNEINITGAKPTSATISISSKGVVNGEITYGDYTYYICNGSIEALETPNCHVSCDYTDGDIVYEAGYTGTERIFTPQCTGRYKIETWGAQGGSLSTDKGGYGAYAVGEISFTAGAKIYANVGGQGGDLIVIKDGVYVASDSGYNGGGSLTTVQEEDTINLATLSQEAYDTSLLIKTGGGATHLATKSGLLSTLESDKGTLNDNGTEATSDDYYESNTIIIVASGGGAASPRDIPNVEKAVTVFDGASGGGINGNSIRININSSTMPEGSYMLIKGGSQVSGGDIIAVAGDQEYSVTASAIASGDEATIRYYSLMTGKFGRGTGYEWPGSGAGFYGGSAYVIGASGGSSYIASSLLTSNTSNNITNKMYCYDCVESSDLKTYTVSTYGTTTHASERNSACSNGYSSTAISGCAKAGNGYIKITYLGQ